jgi:hypothetical protein
VQPDICRSILEESQHELHAERCRGADGVYRLEQDEDLIIIPKP